MRRMAVVYALITVFFASDRLLRRGSVAASFAAGEADRGSTRAIGAALGASTLCLLCAPGLSALGLGNLPQRNRLFRLGVSGMVAGLMLRAWATQILGASYTRTLRVGENQHVIRNGPYHLIRHPGYTGTLLTWLAATVGTANWIACAAVSIILVRVYRRRIEAEEEMLLATFPEEYKDYMRRSWRLLPFIY